MGTITEDLLIEILLRLPTKSLLRFKSVCKQWRSLISSRRFSLRQTLRHPTATALLLRPHLWGLEYYQLSLFKTTPPTPITLPGLLIQSCNSLLLCQFPKNVYSIYNLATGFRRTVEVAFKDVEGLALAFDPCKSPYFKLICVNKVANLLFCYQIVVFDSESSLWSVAVENFSTAPVNNHYGIAVWEEGVYWNNAVHWKMMLGCLLYFDIDKGTIGHGPDVSAIHNMRGTFSHLLVESGGHLHYILNGGSTGSDGSRVGSKVSVYEMERDYSRWSIKYEVEYGGLSSNPTYVSVVGIIRTRNEEESFVLFYFAGKLMSYSSLDESFLEVKDFNIGGRDVNEFVGSRDVHQFVETLAPV